MDLLETMFRCLEEEQEPKSLEYRKNRTLRIDLLDRIRQTMGEKVEEEVTAVYTDHEMLENYRYFLYGLRVGVELLRL